MLAQSGEKWGESKRERVRFLFDEYPQMKEAYSLIRKVHAIFRMEISREVAKEKLYAWYKDFNACTIRKVKAARNAIQGKEEYVLNYFLKRSTNVAAESIYSKIKGFIAQLHCIAHIPFSCIVYV